MALTEFSLRRSISFVMRNYKCSLFSRRGFTLIEMLVSIVILSSLFAIALPIWSAVIPGYQLNSAARQMATELHSARNRAMAQYRRFRLVFNSATTYSVERETTPGAADYTLFSGPKSLPSAITATFNNTPIFQTRGDASPAGTVTLTNSTGASKVITVSSTGKVDIQ